MLTVKVFAYLRLPMLSLEAGRNWYSLCSVRAAKLRPCSSRRLSGGRARPRVTAAPYSADPSLVNSSSYSVSQNSGSAVVEWRRCCCAAALCSPMLAWRGLDTSTKYLQ